MEVASVLAYACSGSALMVVRLVQPTERDPEGSWEHTIISDMDSFK
jgi:hypothetical protein